MEELLSRCPRWVLPGRGDTALCAVSGGLDSMCLLDLLDQWCRERGANIAAAHFNHQLRGAASDRDERFVRDWCAAHDIPFASGDGDVKGFALSEGLSVEEAARELRYAFLRREAAKLGPRARIYTAHHADDQAETVLFNLIRGTGTAGLAGMAVYQGDLVRPLLCVRRSELADYAAARGIPHVEDATNADPEAAARNFLRLRVMPLLEELNPRAVEHISAAAAHVRVGGPRHRERGRPPHRPCGGPGGAGDIVPTGSGGGPGGRGRPDAPAALRPAGRGEKGHRRRPPPGCPWTCCGTPPRGRRAAWTCPTASRPGSAGTG